MGEKSPCTKTIRTRLILNLRSTARSTDLTTPDSSFWGTIKGRVAARRYNNNEDLRWAVEDAFRTITPKMLRTYVTEDMEAHQFVCPALRCTYGFTGHVTKAYVSDSSQIMIAYWSVYGDFSPTL
jgi:hypothetical protein